MDGYVYSYNPCTPFIEGTTGGCYQTAVGYTLYRPHDTIHPPPFWGLVGSTGASGSSWN